MPSFISSIAAQAKAHHESLNAAYSTYYSPSFSATSSTQTSRNNSVAMPEQQKKARSNASKAWNAIKKHNRDMNEAYSVYYSPGVSATSSRSSSAATTPRESVEHQRHEDEAQAPRNYAKAWKVLKTRAVEHHRSVNSAYAHTYAVGASLK